MADPKIVQEIELTGGSDLVRQLNAIGEIGEKTFKALAESAKKLEGAAVSFDKATSNVVEFGRAGTAAAEKISAAVDKIKMSLPVEEPKKQLVELEKTSDSTFDRISSAVSSTAGAFGNLAASILTVKTALGGIAVGGAALTALNTLKNQVVAFSDASLADKLQAVFVDTIKQAVSETEKFNEELASKLGAAKKKAETITIPASSALEGLREALIGASREARTFQDEIDDANSGLSGAFDGVTESLENVNVGLSDVLAKTADGAQKTQVEALAAGRALTSMAAALKDLDRTGPLFELGVAFGELGVKQEIFKKSFHDLASGFATQWEKIKLSAKDGASQITRNAINVEEANLTQAGSIDKLKSAELGLAEAEEKLNEVRGKNWATTLANNALAVEAAYQAQASSTTSLRSAQIGLVEAEERLRVLRGGSANPELQKRIQLERAELAVEEAQANIQRARLAQQQAALAVDAARRKQAEDIQKARQQAVEIEKAELAVQAAKANIQKTRLEGEKAEQAAIDAKRKAIEDLANSLPNVTKQVNNLIAGVQVVGPKFNATAENLAKGFVAALGPNVKAIKDFSGSMDDLDKNAHLVPVFNKLADLFKATGDSALNARIANILFGGSIDDNLLKALSRGSKGLEQARDIAKATAKLQESFTQENLVKFAEQLIKIQNPLERVKKATAVLGETFGTLLVAALDKGGGSVRQLVLPFEKTVENFAKNIEVAKDFKKAIDNVKGAILGMSALSSRKGLDLGLLIAPGATPILNAVAKGIRTLNLDLGALAKTIGDSVTPFVEDFFKLLSGKGKQVDTKSLGTSVGKTINEVVIPAFQNLIDIVKQVSTALSGAFGADISPVLVAIVAVLPFLIGGFNALALAVLAAFGPSTTAGMKSFKNGLKKFGIDVDRIAKFVTDSWRDLMAVLSGSDEPVEHQWVVDLKNAIVDFVKVIPAAAIELGVFVGTVARVVGPGRLAKIALLEITGALGALQKIAVTAGGALVFLERFLLILARFTGPLGPVLLGLALLIAYGKEIKFVFDAVAFTLNKAIKVLSQGFLPDNFITGAGLLQTAILGLEVAVGVLVGRMLFAGKAIAAIGLAASGWAAAIAAVVIVVLLNLDVAKKAADSLASSFNKLFGSDVSGADLISIALGGIAAALLVMTGAARVAGAALLFLMARFIPIAAAAVPVLLLLREIMRQLSKTEDTKKAEAELKKLHEELDRGDIKWAEYSKRFDEIIAKLEATEKASKGAADVIDSSSKGMFDGFLQEMKKLGSVFSDAGESGASMFDKLTADSTAAVDKVLGNVKKIPSTVKDSMKGWQKADPGFETETTLQSEKGGGKIITVRPTVDKAAADKAKADLFDITETIQSKDGGGKIITVRPTVDKAAADKVSATLKEAFSNFEKIWADQEKNLKGFGDNFNKLDVDPIKRIEDGFDALGKRSDAVIDGIKVKLASLKQTDITVPNVEEQLSEKGTELLKVINDTFRRIRELEADGLGLKLDEIFKDDSIQNFIQTLGELSLKFPGAVEEVRGALEAIAHEIDALQNSRRGIDVVPLDNWNNEIAAAEDKVKEFFTVIKEGALLAKAQMVLLADAFSLVGSAKASERISPPPGQEHGAAADRLEKLGVPESENIEEISEEIQRFRDLLRKENEEFEKQHLFTPKEDDEEIIRFRELIRKENEQVQKIFLEMERKAADEKVAKKAAEPTDFENTIVDLVKKFHNLGEAVVKFAAFVSKGARTVGVEGVQKTVVKKAFETAVEAFVSFVEKMRESAGLTTPEEQERKAVKEFEKNFGKTKLAEGGPADKLPIERIAEVFSQFESKLGAFLSREPESQNVEFRGPETDTEAAERDLDADIEQILTQPLRLISEELSSSSSDNVSMLRDLLLTLERAYEVLREIAANTLALVQSKLEEKPAENKVVDEEFSPKPKQEEVQTATASDQGGVGSLAILLETVSQTLLNIEQIQNSILASSDSIPNWIKNVADELKNLGQKISTGLTTASQKIVDEIGKVVTSLIDLTSTTKNKFDELIGVNIAIIAWLREIAKLLKAVELDIPENPKPVFADHPKGIKGDVIDDKKGPFVQGVRQGVAEGVKEALPEGLQPPPPIIDQVPKPKGPQPEIKEGVRQGVVEGVKEALPEPVLRNQVGQVQGPPPSLKIAEDEVAALRKFAEDNNLVAKQIVDGTGKIVGGLGQVAPALAADAVALDHMAVTATNLTGKLITGINPGLRDTGIVIEDVAKGLKTGINPGLREAADRFMNINDTIDKGVNPGAAKAVMELTEQGKELKREYPGVTSAIRELTEQGKELKREYPGVTSAVKNLGNDIINLGTSATDLATPFKTATDLATKFKTSATDLATPFKTVPPGGDLTTPSADSSDLTKALQDLRSQIEKNTGALEKKTETPEAQQFVDNGGRIPKAGMPEQDKGLLELQDRMQDFNKRTEEMAATDKPTHEPVWEDIITGVTPFTDAMKKAAEGVTSFSDELIDTQSAKDAGADEVGAKEFIERMRQELIDAMSDEDRRKVEEELAPPKEELVPPAQSIIPDIGAELGDDFSRIVSAIDQNASDVGGELSDDFNSIVSAIDQSQQTAPDVGAELSDDFSRVVNAIDQGAQQIVAAIQAIDVGGGGEGGTFTEFAGGGIARGPGTGRSDSIMAMVSNGEGIIQAPAMAALFRAFGGGAFNWLNNFHNVGSKRFSLGGLVDMPRFAFGGMVGSELTDAASSSGSHDRGLTLVLDGQEFRSRGSSNDIDNLERAAVLSDVFSLGPNQSWR